MPERLRTSLEGRQSVAYVRQTPEGKIVITPEAVAMLAGLAASRCHGVAGLAGRGWYGALAGDSPARGVQVEISGSRVSLRLGIAVVYGMPIAQVARQVVEEVRQAVEQATGLEVERVRVDVVGIRLEPKASEGAGEA